MPAVAENAAAGFLCKVTLEFVNLLSTVKLIVCARGTGFQPVMKKL